MALIKCPECDGTVSDKAISCPHCGYPLNAVQAPRRKKRASAIKRRRNGSGSVVKLSGNRSHPFEVRVNCRLDERGYPKYDVLSRFEDKIEAESALAEYNKNPYDIETDKLTFAEVYKKFLQKNISVQRNIQSVQNGVLGQHTNTVSRYTMQFLKRLQQISFRTY